MTECLCSLSPPSSIWSECFRVALGCKYLQKKTDFQSFLSFLNSCFVFRTDTNGKEFSILSTELIIAGGNYAQSSKSRIAANVVWKKNHWSMSRIWPINMLRCQSLPPHPEDAGRPHVEVNLRFSEETSVKSSPIGARSFPVSAQGSYEPGYSRWSCSW